MKILGIGVDIVENDRIKVSLKNKKFINRIFTKNEIQESLNLKKKTNFFSKRFAAKEALVKAIGSGFRNDLNFKDIEIINNKLGKPYFVLNKKLTNLICKKLKVKKFNLFLSISDENEYSVAFTIIQLIK
tara:strand:+ start:37 stop:426 length:390 start_codon:yes stop_codon:yes gene_type:complete